MKDIRHDRENYRIRVAEYRKRNALRDLLGDLCNGFISDDEEDKKLNLLKQDLINTLVEARKKAGVTQKEMAQKLLVTDKTISAWESGRINNDSYLMAYFFTFFSQLCDMHIAAEIMDTLDTMANLQHEVIFAQQRLDFLNRSLGVNDHEN